MHLGKHSSEVLLPVKIYDHSSHYVIAVTTEKELVIRSFLAIAISFFHVCIASVNEHLGALIRDLASNEAKGLHFQSCAKDQQKVY